MAPQTKKDDGILPINSVGVALDRDNKNSNAALKWAIDHLVGGNPYIILIHVFKTKTTVGN